MLTIKEALLDIKERGLGYCIVYRYSGICLNLSKYHIIEDAYYFVQKNCSDWEYYSGNLCYPVSDDNNYGKWEGENLKLRLSLIDHLLTKC